MARVTRLNQARHTWSPRTVALRILAARFGDLDGSPPTVGRTNSPFRLTAHQEEAVTRARQILRERRGVLIADSVGLGKTHIALALIEEELLAGRRVGVITPAALRRNWTSPLRELVNSLDLAEPPSLVWTSHTRLARGTSPAKLYAGLDLIVVDEAHAFRNPRTLRYRALAVLARSARLILLTATPVNNSLADLYSLIRLFAGDGDFHDLGIADLSKIFRGPSTTEGSGASDPALHHLLRSIMIRRTRADLRPAGPVDSGTTISSQNPPSPRFPRRAPPTPIRYPLARVYPDLLPETIATLDALTLAPFRLGDYGAGLTSRGSPVPAELIRLGLLKRFESSLAAFHSSISRQLRLAHAFVDSLDRGLLRIPAEHYRLEGQVQGDEFQLTLDELAFSPIPPALELDRLRRDVEDDRRRLYHLHQTLAGISRREGEGRDPKLARLEEVLDDDLRGEPVVVFTEFRATARYLWTSLRDRGGVALIDGGGAFLGPWPAGRQEVIDRFAPIANHAPTPPADQRVNLLIATDILAEGLNLQDARHVISYDLPWNPVRLIQRVGRVDRIASPHDLIFPYHFLPDTGLEEVLQLTRRLRDKLGTIQGSVGTEGEVVAGIGEAEASGSDHHLRSLESEEALRTIYRRLVDEGCEIEVPHPSGPPVTTMTAPPTRPHLLLICCRIGHMITLLIQPARRGARIYEDDGVAREILAAALEYEPEATPSAEDLDTKSPSPALIRRGQRAARRLATTRLATTDAIPPIPTNTPGARAARDLLTRITPLPGREPNPELARRADRILTRLARSHDAGRETEIERALQASKGRDSIEELLAGLEDALQARHVEEPGGGREYEVIGMIEYRPHQTIDGRQDFD